MCGCGQGPECVWNRALAFVWEEGFLNGQEGGNQQDDNPYGTSTSGCTCGFGGFHDDINPRCELNKEATP